jgi:hypothetical protein
MVSRREALAEALRMWRNAERELDLATGPRDALAADIVRYRTAYQLIYTANMGENISRLRAADDRRARATPSTADFHAATQDTEEIAAQIWEQARRGDLDTPPTRAKPVERAGR